MQEPKPQNRTVPSTQETTRTPQTHRSGRGQRLKRIFFPSPVTRMPEEGFTPRQRRLIRGFQIRSSAGTLLLAMAVLAFALEWIFSSVPQRFGAFDQEALGGALLIQFIQQIVVLLIPTALIMLLYRLGNQRIVGRHSPSAALMIMAILAGIPAGLVLLGLNNLYAILLHSLSLNVQPTFTFFQLNPSGPTEVLLFFLVVGFLAPLLEEIVFRGALLAGLSLTGRNALAVLLQATAFTLFFPWGLAVPSVFLMAVLLGYLRKRGDSLILNLIARFMMHLTLVLGHRILPIITRETNIGGQEGNTLFYASLIATLTASLMLIPIIAMFNSTAMREIRLTQTSVTKLTTRQRVLMPVQEDKKESTEPGPASSVPGDPFVLPSAAHIWSPSDWKFNLALFLFWVLYWLR